MGIVKISDQMHDNLRLASIALDRSINAQAEHWLKIGMLIELYPNKTYNELTQLLLEQSLHSNAMFSLESILKHLSTKSTEVITP
ncbi:ParD-like family protein [Pseudomonas sp. F1_0610]|uniref:ParD-like family protein n=1 Tax=Pseudomonas sp. F1_0610 TaxID=3114284 RepID=UPI0039C3E580